MDKAPSTSYSDRQRGARPRHKTVWRGKRLRRLHAGRNMAVPRKVLGLGAALAVLLAVFLLWQWLRHDGDQLVLYGNVDIRQVT